MITHTRTAITDRQTRRMPATPELAAWWKSGERVGATTNRRVLWLLACVFAVVSVVTAATSYQRQRNPLTNAVMRSFVVNPVKLSIAGLILVAALALATGGYWRYGAVKADFVQRFQRQKIYTAIDAITNDPELQRIIHLNQARMDAYHELTLGQAAHAYRNTQAAMAVGFLVLAAGAVAALTISASDTGGRVVVGGLAGIGTTLSGYIVATFLRSQQEALRQLNVYFRQPLINSYLLTAERWALKLPSQTRGSTLAHMADQVVAQAFGTPAGTAFGTPAGTAFGTPAGTAFGTPAGNGATPTGLPVAAANGAPASSNGRSLAHWKQD